MHLLARLARLEKNAPRQPALTSLCPICGGNADGTASGTQVYTCEFERGQSRESDFCRGCGRQLVYHIEFDKGG